MEKVGDLGACVSADKPHFGRLPTPSTVAWGATQPRVANHREETQYEASLFQYKASTRTGRCEGGPDDSADDFNKLRRFAARHVVRSLNIPAENFPVDVHMFYQIKETPVPGTPPSEELKPLKQVLIETYAFAKPSEVWP